MIQKEHPVRKANEPQLYRLVHLYSRHFWLYLARIVLLVSLSFSHVPSSLQLLNEQLIPCLSVLFVAFLPSVFLGRLLAGLPARPYRHSIASASLFSTLSPRHISNASPFFLVVCRRELSSPLPHLSFALLSHPLRAQEKEWRETTVARDGKSLATHLSTRLIPLFSRESSVASCSESPSAHGTRSGWIKLELQRMIGQSFTRRHPFFFLGTLVGTPAEIPAADVGMTNITARWCISNVAHSFSEV